MAVLPFDRTGTVTEMGGVTTILEGLPLAYWPAEPVETSVGEVYDHEGECDISGADALLDENNRQIEVEGKTFTVIRAELAEYVPHIMLRLRQIRGG